MLAAKSWIPNYRIGNITAEHELGKSDSNVQEIYFKKSFFDYFPTFDYEFLVEKFPKLKSMNIEGREERYDESTDPKTPLSTANGRLMVPEFIEILTINNFGTKLTQLSPSLISSVLKLKDFELSINEIEEIPQKFFHRNSELEHIYLGGNRIAKVEEILLFNLPELKTFKIQNNNLGYIPSRFFSRNPKLESVVLAYNRITLLAGNMFENNRMLKSISILQNEIKTLPPNLIANSSSIEAFDAPFNKISSIPENFFAQNSKLTRVDLSSNLCYG